MKEVLFFRFTQIVRWFRSVNEFFIYHICCFWMKVELPIQYTYMYRSSYQVELCFQFFPILNGFKCMIMKWSAVIYGPYLSPEDFYTNTITVICNHIITWFEWTFLCRKSPINLINVVILSFIPIISGEQIK